MINFAFSCYKQLLALTPDQVTLIGDTVLIPCFEPTTLHQIIDEVLANAKKGRVVKHIHGSTVVVGDLHGHFHELMRIILTHRLPPQTQYLFLGDYVDRGEYSPEVITFLFVLKAMFPDHITLLRGNHEDRSINSEYGFREQLILRYDSDNGFKLWEHFNEVFDYMPFICIIDHSIFCVHGGIPRADKSLEEIASIQFPIKENSQLLNDLTWSDPTDQTIYYRENPRGRGLLFGKAAAKTYLDKYGYKLLIRSHQMVNGYKYSFNKKVLTIFSIANYQATNMSGYAIVNSDLSVTCTKNPYIKPISYKDASFYHIITPSNVQSGGQLPKLAKTSINGIGGSNILLIAAQRRMSLKRLSGTNIIKTRAKIGSPPLTFSKIHHSFSNENVPAEKAIA